MKGFRFTLERVLDLRKREEEAIRADLAARTTREDEARRRAEARRMRLSVLLDAEATTGLTGGGTIVRVSSLPLPPT